MNSQKSIYIIGAQCTGKTTLVDALEAALRSQEPAQPFYLVPETARTILRDHNFTRDDLAIPERAFELQKLILEAQFTEEMQHSNETLLCDRSGLDTLVYATKFTSSSTTRSLTCSEHWQFLKSRMQKSLVIVCAPNADWLID